MTPQIPAAIAGKIEAPLWAAIQDELAGADPLPSMLDANPLRNLAKRSTSGDIEMVVEVANWSASVVDKLSALGFEVTLSNESLKMVQGWASTAEIDAMLTKANVAHVSLPVYPVLSVGAETTEGDEIHRADDVRSIFAGLGIDGSGVQVGVISDGVENWTTVAASDDLPDTINVNPSLPGDGDEGTAMLEIIHDLAPGAELFFSSGLSGAMAMIDSVNWLVSQGVDIIVDDLGFFDQPYFEDGAIADAVANAVASGVSYFSAAGNQALDHYQADFTFGALVDIDGAGNFQELHDFGAAGLELGVELQGDGVLGVSGAPELNVFLQWSDPFGGSTNDYTLFLVDQSLNVLASSVRISGTQNPVERLAVDFDGPGAFTGFLVVGRDVGADDRELELFVFNEAEQEFAVASDGIIGHQAVPEVVTVGAIDQDEPGNDGIEDFSNRGQSTVYTDFGSQTSTVRNSLDGAGIDGVETQSGALGLTNAFGTSLNPFSGTSAAAPHVAGIAALLLDLDSGLSPAGVSAILAKGAVDILSERYDGNSGFGRFDAFVAATSGVDLPKVIDVMLDGSGWTRNAHSYHEIIKTDSQLKPIYTQDADAFQIKFSQHVVIGQNDLTLYTDDDATVAFDSFSYDADSHVATWSLNDPLPAGKYRVELDTTIEDAEGRRLDGDWTNLSGPNSDDSVRTPDDFDDDLTGRAFISGDGIPGTTGGAFVFYFSYLPGDYNQDGIVDGVDDDTAVVKDGDGDGVIENGLNGTTTQDTAIATANSGDQLPFRISMGDYRDDDVVDGNNSIPGNALFDYGRWKATFGAFVPAYTSADGNGNGEIDAADYVVWGLNSPSHSAWYVGPLGQSAALPVVDFGNPPQVDNVTISGSNSIHEAYSFDAHDGSGEQLRTVPVGGADTVSITFSEDVNIGPASLRMIGLYTANVPELAEFSYDMGSMTASWRFVGWTFGDQYALMLDDAVTDVEGNALDGEWTNPAALTTTNAAVSEFPSGDGNASGDFRFVMTLLPGDANLDLEVTGADLAILGSHYNNGQLDELFSEGDFNGDGQVTTTDLSAYGAHSGMDLTVVWLLADLDGDFDVDEDDAETLSGNIGMSSPTWADGDLDENGSVALSDLDLMFEQFGLDLEVVS